MNRASVVSVAFLMVGFLISGIGIPLALGRIPPNRWYGFRTHRTLADPAVWYAVNGVVGKDLLVAGAVVAVFAVVLTIAAHGTSGAQWVEYWCAAITLTTIALVIAHGVWVLWQSS